MIDVTSSEGLRERRRRLTSVDIHNAALRLARLRGVDNVTVEEISVAAGVSARTFFNYFPSKEVAIAYAPLEISAEQAAEFVANGPAPYSVLLNDLLRLAIRDLADNAPSRQEMADLFAVGHASAGVASAVLSQFDLFQKRLAGLVAERADMEPGDDIPTLIAALALAVVRTGLVNWADAATADGEDTPVPHVQRAATLIQSFFTDPAGYPGVERNVAEDDVRP
jgi:AcrR family transcriptional regulator